MAVVISDEELWARAAAGEADAFGELFERHCDAIYNYLFRRMGDWSAAQDLTSVVFLEAQVAVQELLDSSAGRVVSH